MNKQSFGVEDIRRIRNEDSVRYEGMTYEEVTKNIHDRAKEGYAIIEKIRREKSKKTFRDIAKPLVHTRDRKFDREKANERR